VQRGFLTADAEQAALDLADQAAEGGGVVDAGDIGRAGVLGAVLLADPRTMVVLVEAVVHQGGLEVVVRREGDRGADAVQVAVVDVVAGDDVLAVAVTLQGRTGHAHREHIADRDVDHAAELLAAIVAELDPGVGLKAVDRLVGDQVDHAAGGRRTSTRSTS